MFSLFQALGSWEQKKKRKSERKNDGGIRRGIKGVLPRFRLSPTIESLEQATKFYTTGSNIIKQGVQTAKYLVAKQGLIVFCRQIFPVGESFMLSFSGYAKPA